MKIFSTHQRRSDPGQVDLRAYDITNNSLYRDFFNASEKALVFVSVSGRVIDVNTQFEKLTGYCRTDLLGTSILSLARLLTRKSQSLWFHNPFTKRNNNKERAHEIIAYAKSGKRLTLKVATRLIVQESESKKHPFVIEIENWDVPSDNNANKLGEIHKSLIDHISIGIFRTTPGLTGKFLEVNPAMETITGYFRDELLNMDVADLYVHPEERGKIVSHVLSGELTEAREVLIRRKDGKIIVVRDEKVAVAADDGRAIYLEGFLEDITERKSIEEELRKKKGNLSVILENAPIGIATYAEGHFLTANRRFCQILGYTQEELSAMDIKDVTYHEDIAESTRKINELDSENSNGFVIEKRYVRKDGKIIFGRVSVNAIRDAASRSSYHIAQLEDITACKAAEKALSDSEEKFRNLAEQSPNMIFINKGGRIIYTNKSCSELTGYSREEFYSSTFNFLDIVTPQCRRLLAQSFSAHVSGKEVSPIEYSILTKDGKVLDCILTTKLVNFDDSPAILGTVTDITEHKSAESRIRLERDNFLHSLDASPMGIQIFNRIGEIVYVNRTLLDMWGYNSKVQLQSIPLERAFTPESMALIHETFKENSSGVDLSPRELTMICADGRLRDVRTYTKDVIWNGENCVQTLYEDITERNRVEQSFKESERRLKEAQTAGRIGDWEYDIRTRKITWSDEMYELFKRDKALGPPSIDEDTLYYPPHEITLFKRFIKRVIKTGQTCRYDAEARLSDQRVVYFSNTLHPIKDQHGIIIKLFGTAQDITERKQAEMLLELSEKKYATLVEQGSDSIVIVQDSRIVYANSKVTELAGFTVNEVVGREFLDFVSPSCRELAAEGYKKRVAGEEVLNRYEIELLDKSGKAIMVESSGSVIEYEGKTADIITLRDVTERKKTEELLRFSDAAFKSIHEGVFATDNNLIVTRWNEISEKIFGVKSVDAIGRHISEITTLIEEYPGQNKKRFELLLSMGFNREEQRYRTPGGDIWLDVHCQAIESDGKRFGWVNLVVDITERKKMEIALQTEKENYRNSVETSPVGIQILTFQGELIYVNRTQLDLWGYSSLEELKAMPVEKRFTPDSVGVIKEKNKKRQRGMIPEPYEVTIICKDGRKRCMETHNKEIIWNGEKCVQIIDQDITERKQAEELYTTLAKNSPVGVYITQDRKFVFTNPAFNAATGFTEKELEDRPALSLVEPEYREMVRKNAIEMLLGKSDQPYQFKYVTKEGQKRWVIERVSSITYGNKRASLGTFLDISDIKKAEEELRESEKRFRDLVDNAPVGITMTALDGRVVEVNKTLAKMHGYTSKEEFINSPVMNRFENLKDRGEWLSLTQKTGRVEGYEIRTKRKDGSLFWTALTSIPRVSETGEPQFITVSQDITERKRLEEEKHMSERKHKELAESISDVFFAVDNNLKYTYWNKATEELTGIPANEAIGKTIVDVFPDNKAMRQAKDAFSQAITAQKQMHLTIEYPGDRRITHEMSIYPSVEGASVFVRDITERKEAEEALKRSEEKLRLMFQSVAEGIAILDLDGIIIDVNQKMVSIHGLASRDKMIGKSVLDFVAHGDWENVKTGMQQLGKTGSLERIEFKGRKADGQTYSAEASAGLLTDGSGNAIGSVVTLRDITELKTVRDSLMLTDRLASIGELVSGVAHELNNPLTSVSGFCQLLMESNLDGDIKEEITIISKESQRAIRIVKDLLTFARKHPPAKQPSQINNMIEEVLRLRAYEQGVDNIFIIRHLDSELPEVLADYFQIQQMFLNIIINAEYFMIKAHNGGKLTITTERVGDFVRISFSDDGLGISPENLKKIFNPFFTTKEVGKGTGLGLSICHGIVTEHGGTIRAVSEKGNGATFIVELPIDNPN